MNTKLQLRGGEMVPIAIADMTEMDLWAPTVPQVREAIFAAAIFGPDYCSVGMPCDPIAKQFVPNTHEVERINDMALEAITAGRLLDLGHLPNEVIKFCGSRGGPLWNRSALGMPFTAPWLLFHTWDTHGLRGEGVHTSCVYLVNPSPDGDAFEVCELQPTILGTNKTLLISDRGVFWKSTINEGKYTVSMAPSAMRYWEVSDANLELLNGGMPPMHAAAANVVDPVMTALLILNTRNVERETISVAAKLNHARRKNGKPAIPPYDRVFSADYVTAISLRGKARPAGEDQGGTHRSPVPHIRMGHPRQYTTGRSIFIADTLVAVPPEQRAAFKSKRTHYRVQP